jgi:hypothetical protein
MNANIFMISDASYSQTSQCAGLGVIDLCTNKRYAYTMPDIGNSHIAEYHALLYSVRIAIKNRYSNVVFVYDNKMLQLDSLKKWIEDKIHCAQFLWLKREYVNDADKLARKARSLQEKLIPNKLLKRQLLQSDLVQQFKHYSQHKIIRAFFTIANDDEYAILKSYRDNHKYPPLLVDEESLEFYSDIYNLLTVKKNRDRFYSYIDKNFAGNIDTMKFKTPKSNEHYHTLISKIIKILKNPNPGVKKRIGQSSSLITKQTAKEPLLSKIHQLPIKELRKLSISLAKNSSDKKLLQLYFSAKKTQEYQMTGHSIELFALIYHLLPAPQNKSFIGFLKNRLKNEKELYNMLMREKKKFDAHKFIALVDSSSKYYAVFQNSLKIA